MKKMCFKLIINSINGVRKMCFESLTPMSIKSPVWEFSIVHFRKYFILRLNKWFISESSSLRCFSIKWSVYDDTNTRLHKEPQPTTMSARNRAIKLTTKVELLFSSLQAKLGLQFSHLSIKIFTLINIKQVH